MERSCTVNLVTQKQTLSWKGVALYIFLHKYKHFDGKDLHCKPCYTKTNTFMERSCTVNLPTQKQTLSWKGVAL